MRPLTTTVFTPRARHSRSRFGQISVSIITNSRGFTMSQRAPDDEGQVEGEVEDARRHRRSSSPPADRPWSWSRGTAAGRVPLLQVGGERPHRQRLPHRHGVDPDRVLAVHVERDRQVAEPLAQAADVLPVAQRLVQEVRRRTTNRTRLTAV